MRNRIIEVIEKSINSSSRPFLREQDLQIKIINDLKKEIKEIENIFFEYNIKTDLLSDFNYPWIKDKNVYVDIVVEISNKFFPIEIKYKTISEEFTLKVFGEDGLLVSTLKHGASNLGCYDLWKDVKRLEILKERFQNVEQGIILFVTNDSGYKRLPKNINVGYAQFSINEGRLINNGSTLNWNGELKTAPGRPKLSFKERYRINWKDLDTINWNKVNNNIKHFYFIL
jgi:hypothetical protein